MYQTGPYSSKSYCHRLSVSEVLPHQTLLASLCSLPLFTKPADAPGQEVALPSPQAWYCEKSAQGSPGCKAEYTVIVPPELSFTSKPGSGDCVCPVRSRKSRIEFYFFLDRHKCIKFLAFKDICQGEKLPCC
uniref:Uncharacterized protein n=1 Tax=Sphaerodactylus townsendi TaxID=933632 RepID=A0ACB8FRM2_9SAUR